MATRRNHYDVTNTVHVADPRAVEDAVCSILAQRYPETDVQPLRVAFSVFARLYAGALPGYAACDTWYHDVQHSLDCALTMARLLDGYDRSVPQDRRMGARRAVLGVIVALFHDAGYIRREDDEATHGAEFTLCHVARSGEFLAGFLPTVGYADAVDLTHQIVHYTGYEIELDQVRVRDAKDRKLGFLLGSADILAQVADRCYLEKCRDYLYREFEICGLAGKPRPDCPKPVYESADHLMSQTPDFWAHLRDDRLNGYFQGIYRYMEAHFGAGNPYLQAIDEHLARLRPLLRRKEFHRLRRRPQRIGPDALRRSLRLRPHAEFPPHGHPAQPSAAPASFVPS